MKSLGGQLVALGKTRVPAGSDVKDVLNDRSGLVRGREEIEELSRESPTSLSVLEGGLGGRVRGADLV